MLHHACFQDTFFRVLSESLTDLAEFELTGTDDSGPVSPATISQIAELKRLWKHVKTLVITNLDADHNGTIC